MVKGLCATYHSSQQTALFEHLTTEALIELFKYSMLNKLHIEYYSGAPDLFRLNGSLEEFETLVAVLQNSGWVVVVEVG